MMKKLSIKPIMFYLASFMLPFIILMIALIGLRIAPFGDNTLLIADANGLYINSLAYVGRMFKGLEGIVYSFKKGLGGNMMGYIGGSFMNPVYLVFSFFSINDYPIAYTIVCLLNLSSCGLTMYILLKDLYGHKRDNLIFSTSYALMGFSAAYCYQVMFFTSMQVLPLMIIGLRRIFQRRNPWLYIISIAYSMVTNYYQGFVLCVFSGLVFLTMFWLEKNNMKGQRLSIFINYTISSICGGLIPIITWLPAFLSLKGGRLDQTGISDFSFAENMPFLEIASKLFTGANSANEQINGLPNIFVGLLPVALAILFFMNKKIDNRKKTAAGVLLGVYLLSFYIIAFNMLMHGGTTTNWFNYRYSYLFSFLILLIAAYEWQYVMETPGKELKKCFVIMIIATIIIFSKRYSFVIAGTVLLDYAILLLMAFALHMHRKDSIKNPAKTVTSVVLVLTCISMLCNYTISTYKMLSFDSWKNSFSDYDEVVNKVNPLVYGVQLGDHNFYRMEVNKQRSANCGNDPFLYGYNGVGHGGSHERNFVREELHKLGVHWFDMRNYYEEGIPAATDALLGIKYLIASEDLSEEKDYFRMTDMEKIGLASNGKNYDLYQSNYALPIAFMSELAVNYVELTDENVFDNLNLVWQSISGSDGLVFVEEDDITFESINMIDTRSISSEEAKALLKEIESDSIKDYSMSESTDKGTDISDSNQGATVSVIMDEPPQFYASVKFAFEAKCDGPVYIYHRAVLSAQKGAQSPIIRYMGNYKQGDTVEGYLPVESEYVNRVTLEEFSGRFCAAYADLDKLQYMSKTVQKQPTTIEKVKDSYLVGTMTAGENQELLLTIPWDEGWTCYVDGQKAELKRVLNLFMAVQVSPGEHTYEMIYEPEGLRMGVIISIITLIFTAIFLVFGYRFIDREFEKHINKISSNEEDDRNAITNDVPFGADVNHKISVNREHGLDFVKVVATFMIILHHYQQTHHVFYENSINFYYGKFYFGYLVELFFVISGYLMFKYVDRINDGLCFREFFGRKYLRFQPLMMITVIFALIFMSLFEMAYEMPWGDNLRSIGGIIVAALGLQAWKNVLFINNPIWYVGVLLFCYVIMYICVKISKRLSVPTGLVFSFVIIAGIIIYVANINVTILNNRSSRGMYAFFWGLVLAELLKRNKPSRMIIALGLGFMIIVPILIAFANEYVGHWINFSMTFVYYTSVIIVFTSSIAKRIFHSSRWSLASEVSYNAYMWHSPVFMLAAIVFFVVGIVPDFANIITLLGIVVTVYLIAVLSYKIIDLPSKSLYAKIRKGNSEAR